MIKENTVTEHKEFLNLHDLIVDEKTEELSKYLSLSIESLGDDMRLVFTTLEEIPTSYSSTIIDAPYTDMQCLLEETLDI